MKYRKKPIVIEAIQFDYSREGIAKLRDFCGEENLRFSRNRHPSSIAEVEILTLEDGADGRAQHVATQDDYIIKGIQGEFYPCKPEIFNDTYELVGDA